MKNKTGIETKKKRLGLPVRDFQDNMRANKEARTLWAMGVSIK